MQNKHFPFGESKRTGRGLGQIPNFYRKFVSGAPLSAPEESSISGLIGFICLNFVDLRAFLGVKFGLRDLLCVENFTFWNFVIQPGAWSKGNLIVTLGTEFQHIWIQYQENPRTGPELKERNFHLINAERSYSSWIALHLIFLRRQGATAVEKELG